MALSRLKSMNFRRGNSSSLKCWVGSICKPTRPQLMHGCVCPSPGEVPALQERACSVESVFCRETHLREDLRRALKTMRELLEAGHLQIPGFV